MNPGNVVEKQLAKNFAAENSSQHNKSSQVQ